MCDATFPYGLVASLFCISDNMLLKDMMRDSVLEINFSEINMMLHKWWFEVLVHRLEER